MLLLLTIFINALILYNHCIFLFFLSCFLYFLQVGIIPFYHSFFLHFGLLLLILYSFFQFLNSFSQFLLPIFLFLLCSLWRRNEVRIIAIITSNNLRYFSYLFNSGILRNEIRILPLSCGFFSPRPISCQLEPNTMIGSCMRFYLSHWFCNLDLFWNKNEKATCIS